MGSCLLHGFGDVSIARSHQTPDECLHGMVQGEEAQAGAGAPSSAQLRDQQAPRGRVEVALGRGEKAVHRRSEKDPQRSYG